MKVAGDERDERVVGDVEAEVEREGDGGVFLQEEECGCE